MACTAQTTMPNRNNNNIRYKDHTGAHVAHAPFHDHDQTESKSADTHHSNNDESMDVQQPNVKDYRCSHHHFIPTQIFLLALLFVAINSLLCSCGHNYPHYSVTDKKVSISNDAAINQDFSIMAVSTNDDTTCGVAERSSDNHAHNERVLGDNAPLLALLGVDWEMLAYLHNLEYYSLKSAGTEMILHPMATYDQQRCKRLGPTLNNHRCSKLDDTLLNQCSPTDHDDQDSNTSSSFCPLQNSKYLHLYTHYTMISTMKGLLLSDDIISIIVHQKMLQIRLKFFPLIFWLMVIGLTFTCFHVSGTNYDDINCGGLGSIQHSSGLISSQSSNGDNLRPLESDSDSAFSYHTASNEYYYGNIPSMISESESDLELFQASIPVSSGANHDHICATVVPKRENKPSLLHGIALPHWEDGVCEQMQPLDEDNDVYPHDVAFQNPEPIVYIITFLAPSPFFGDNPYLDIQEDYPPPIQETQESIQ